MKKFKYGFTEVVITDKDITISHGGNMGNSIKESVNPNLEKLGFPSVENFKKTHEVIKEEGSPDYMWSLKLKKT